jgi:MFS-type transporter involved in bile tolerance (Atg22 family)
VPVQQDTPALLTVLRLHFRLTPLMLFSGINGAFLFCVLPGLMPLMLVPKVSMVIAVVEFVMCFAYGRIADASGSGSVLATSLCVQVVSVVFLCYVALVRDDTDKEALWYVATVLIAAADAGWQSQTYSVIGGTGTGGRRVQAFAVFCVTQHCGFAVAWGLVSLLTPSDPVTFCAYWVGTAAIAIMAFCGWLSHDTMEISTTKEELYEPLHRVNGHESSMSFNKGGAV